jgi:hypothetical protein
MLDVGFVRPFLLRNPGQESRHETMDRLFAAFFTTKPSGVGKRLPNLPLDHQCHGGRDKIPTFCSVSPYSLVSIRLHSTALVLPPRDMSRSWDRDSTGFSSRNDTRAAALE